MEASASGKQSDPNSAPGPVNNLQKVGHLPPVLPSYNGGQ